MFLKKSFVPVLLLISAAGASAQTAAPAAVPPDEQKIERMKQEIELLRQRQEFEKVKNDISKIIRSGQKSFVKNKIFDKRSEKKLCYRNIINFKKWFNFGD